MPLREEKWVKIFEIYWYANYFWGWPRRSSGANMKRIDWTVHEIIAASSAGSGSGSRSGLEDYCPFEVTKTMSSAKVGLKCFGMQITSEGP